MQGTSNPGVLKPDFGFQRSVSLTVCSLVLSKGAQGPAIMVRVQRKTTHVAARGVHLEVGEKRLPGLQWIRKRESMFLQPYYTASLRRSYL